MHIINKLTLKQLLANKKRTVVTIVGIIISVAMFTAVTTFVTSFMEMMRLEVSSYDGSWHVAYDNLTSQQIDSLKNDDAYQNSVLFQKIDTLLIDENNPIFIELNQLDNYSKEIKLLKGNYPANSNEIIISKYYQTQNGVKVGDEITVKTGATQISDKFIETEQLESTAALPVKTFKVVGIYQSTYLDQASYYNSFYTANSSSIISSKMYLTLNHVDNDIFDNGSNTAQSLGINSGDISYHQNLLYYYGISNNDGFNQAMMTAVGIVVVIIMIGSVGLIYNAFAISLNERSRYLGTLSSIGATKRQKKQSVYFEGLVVGIIAIILGVIAGVGGMAVTFKVINPILANLGQEIGFPLAISFKGILIAVICAIITIFISSIIPAYHASKISPIAAITNQQDTKIKVRNIKTSFLTHRIFGFEGDLAMKNIKRNKNRYRITLFSLIISSILFLTASGFTYYLKESYDMTSININYDGYININSQNQELINELAHLKNTTQIAVAKETSLNLETSLDNINPELLSFLTENEQNYGNTYFLDLNLVTYNQEYLDSIPNLNKELQNQILINKENNIKLNRKYKQTDILKENLDHLIGTTFNNNGDEIEITLNKIKYTNQYLLGQTPHETHYSLNLLVSNDTFNQLINQYQLNSNNTNIYYTSNNNEAVLKEIKEITDNYPEESLYSFNLSEDIKQANQLILIINIFTYGFIILIGLISIANIINTISTSMALRTKEFSMLKSIGMTPRAFNKMIYFESLFYGIKTLIYSLPLGFIIMYFLYENLAAIFERSFSVPINSFIIITIAIFVIVFTTLAFSSQKIKKLNIIDGLKNDNN